jgi:hypothetical protein
MTVRDLRTYLATQEEDLVVTFRSNGVSVEPTGAAVDPARGILELFDVDETEKALILLQ